MDGIVCVKKEADWTSFDVVAKMRGVLQTRKIGHIGTLDPLATGVLPLLIGSATKACALLCNEDKTYLATMRFGLTTDTLDSSGQIRSQCQSEVTREDLKKVLPAFTGEISQIPPMYSAIKVGGKKLYELARAGKTIERTARLVTIHTLSLLSFDKEAQSAVIRVACAKGTYIRSLIDDIGQTLEVGAIMTGLVREMAGGFSLADCHTIHEWQAFAEQGTVEKHLLPVEQLFLQEQKIVLSQSDAAKYLNGVKLPLERLLPKQEGAYPLRYRIYDEQQQFLGLARPDLTTMQLRIERNFRNQT